METDPSTNNYGSKTVGTCSMSAGPNVDDVRAVGVGGDIAALERLLWEQGEKTLAYDPPLASGTGPTASSSSVRGGLYMSGTVTLDRRDVGTTSSPRRVWVKSEMRTWSLVSWGNDPSPRASTFSACDRLGCRRVVGVSRPTCYAASSAPRLTGCKGGGIFNTVLEYDGTAWRPLPSPQSPQRPPPVF